MPTIDELVLELMLDSSQFSAEQKKAILQIQKTANEQVKANKDAQRSWKVTNDAITQTKNELIAFGTTVLGINGFKELVESTTKTNAALGRTSQMLDMSARDIDAYDHAVAQFGGTADGFNSSVQSMQGHIADLKLGGNESGFLTALSQLGAMDAVDMKTGTVNLDKLADAIKKVKDQQGEQAAYSLASSLGIDQGTFQMLVQGGDAVKKLHDQYYALSGVTSQNVQGAQDLSNEWADLEANAHGLAQKIVSDLTPVLGDVIGDANGLITDFRQLDDATGGWAGKVVALGAALAAIKVPMSLLKMIRTGLGAGEAAAAEGVAAGESGGLLASLAANPVVAGVLAMVHSEGLNKGEDEFMAHVRASYGQKNSGDIVKYFESQGWTHDQALGIAVNIQAESGGNASASGDNGNAYGIGQWHKDRQAQFQKLYGHDIQHSTLDEQLAFYQWELQHSEKRAGADLSKATSPGQAAAIVSSEFERPADVAGEMSRRAMIANQYAGMVGAQATAQIPQGGQTTVETNIQNVNVSTQATDANGIARDMGKALQQNALISYGMNGAV